MKHLVNNWTFGEMTPKLGGRFDFEMYAQGCETLLNFRTMLQGGITRRPPLKHVALASKSRLIPFTLNTGVSFLVELSHKKLSVWRYYNEGLEKVIFLPSGNDYLVTEFSDTHIWDIQHAQYYDRVYFAHSNYKQSVLSYSANAFSFDQFNLTNDVGNMMGITAKNFPAVVGICQNRLWFASSENRPYTIWVSRPPYGGSFNHHDFTTFDEIEVSTEVIKDPDKWPYTTNSEGDQIIDFSDPHAFMEDALETEEVINAKCAMELELASGRNDTIKWVAGMDHIFIGTEANEWMTPYNIDPTNQSASMQSAYGSIPVQPQVMHNGIFFIQRGNRLREFVMGEYGPICNDLSFTADHILKAGVKEITVLKNPDPMIICLLKDGTLAVLSYDKMYGTQGWSRWETDGSFISLAAREEPDGQILYAIVKRNEDYYLEYFDFNESDTFIDRANEAQHGNLEYRSLMVANRFDFNSDQGPTVGRSKKAKEVWVRCLDTGKVSTGVDESYMQKSINPVGSEDYRISISGGSRKELRVRIESVEGDPITLLAMTYDVEVN